MNLHHLVMNIFILFLFSLQGCGSVKASDCTLEGARGYRIALPCLPIHFPWHCLRETGRGPQPTWPYTIGFICSLATEMQRCVYPWETCVPFTFLLGCSQEQRFQNDFSMEDTLKPPGGVHSNQTSAEGSVLQKQTAGIALEHGS